MRTVTLITTTLALSTILSGCTYNPFVANNHMTGSPEGTAIGAAAGAGLVAAWNGPKYLMGVAGVTGGALGYYATTIRYDAGGVMQSGGDIYRNGQYVGIYIPTDKLFVTNTRELRSDAKPILDSAAAVLERFPKNNILISVSTSGFDRPKREKKLSLLRAKEVAAYLWNNDGINNFIEPTIDLRKLNYVAYANHFPISSDLTNKGVRQNSRVQITSYPSKKALEIDHRSLTFNNIGALTDPAPKQERSDDCANANDKDMKGCFRED